MFRRNIRSVNDLIYSTKMSDLFHNYKLFHHKIHIFHLYWSVDCKYYSVNDHVTHSSGLTRWFNWGISLTWYRLRPRGGDDWVIVGKHWLSHSFHQCNSLSCEEPLTVLWPAVVNTAALWRPWKLLVLPVHMTHGHLVKHHLCLIILVFSASFVTKVMMSWCDWIKSRTSQVYTVHSFVKCNVWRKCFCSHTFWTFDAASTHLFWRVVCAKTYHRISSFLTTFTCLYLGTQTASMSLFLSSAPTERDLLSAPQVYPLHVLHCTCRHSL